MKKELKATYDSLYKGVKQGKGELEDGIKDNPTD